MWNIVRVLFDNQLVDVNVLLKRGGGPNIEISNVIKPMISQIHIFVLEKLMLMVTDHIVYEYMFWFFQHNYLCPMCCRHMFVR